MWKLTTIGIFMIFGAIFYIAAASMGIQCFSKCSNPYQYNTSENFLVANIVLGLVMFCLSIYIIYLGRTE